MCSRLTPHKRQIGSFHGGPLAPNVSLEKDRAADSGSKLGLTSSHIQTGCQGDRQSPENPQLLILSAFTGGGRSWTRTEQQTLLLSEHLRQFLEHRFPPEFPGVHRCGVKTT